MTMNTNLSTEQALQERLRELQNLETVKSVRNKKWEDTLANAADWQKAGVKKQWDEWKAKSEEDIERVKSMITHYEKQIASKEQEAQQRARAALDAWKAEALQAWKASGGDEKGFNEAWPQMEQERLKQKTLEALSKETKSL